MPWVIPSLITGESRIDRFLKMYVLFLFLFFLFPAFQNGFGFPPLSLLDPNVLCIRAIMYILLLPNIY